MLDYYAKRAPYYDAVYEKPERAADIAFLKKYLSSRFINRIALEIACGTGYWTQHLAPVCARYVATDAIPEPLTIAKQRSHGGHARFALADAYSLPGTLGQFDAAFAGLWLSHVPIEKLSIFFASLHARLEPGARVVLLENSTAQLNDFPIVETDAEGNTYQLRTLRDGSQHRVLKNFPSETALHEMISGVATPTGYHALDNFWLFEYILR